MSWIARWIAVLSVLALPVSTAYAGEGTPDPGYGVRGVSVLPTGNGNQSSGSAVVAQGDKAVVAGEALDDTGGGAKLRAVITRTNADGTRDAGFGTGGQTLVTAGTGNSQFNAVTLAPDGKIVAVGSSFDAGTFKILVARFSANGTPDGTFGGTGVVLLARGNGGLAAANAVIVEADGSVIVAGEALDGGITKMVRAKLSSGGIDQPAWGGLTAIGADGLARANAIGRLGDGSYVLAGDARDGDTVPFLARVSSSTGALTGGWGNQGNGTSLIAVDTIGGAFGLTVKGGQIAITGALADVATELLVAAFSAATGALDGSFGTGGIFHAQIGDGGTSIGHAITTDGAGRFLVAGEASHEVDGASRFGFMTARLTSGGALDTSYGGSGAQPGAALADAPGGAAAHGNGLALAADGKALLAGRVGDGPGESLATARFCTEDAQPCFSNTGDVALPPPSDLAMSEQCGSANVTGTVPLDVSGGYAGRVTVTVTSSAPALFSVSPASQRVEAKNDGPLSVSYTVTHHGNKADSATLTIGVQPEGRTAFTRTLTVRNTVLNVTAISTTTATTPRDLKPGSPITLTVPGIDICGTPGYAGAGPPMVRVGNDRAVVPGTRGADSVTITTPRLATTGTVELATLDATGIVSRAGAPQQVMVDTYRNTMGFAFRNFDAEVSFDDMRRAFGDEDIFLCIPVPFVGCVPSGVPDPWAVTVWTVLQFNNGACFGFSWESEWMRKGRISPADFAANATNPFTIGGQPQKGDVGDVRAQGITDEIEAAWARQFSEDYMAFYRRQMLFNLVAQTPSSLRSTIEDMLRSGDHPLLSIRDGGTIDGLHVVTAYDVETDPNEAGAYFIYVYDSNAPFNPTDANANGNFNSDRLAGTNHTNNGAIDSRIHVHADGSWQLPSSSFGGKQVANIIAGQWDLPTEDAEIISPVSGVATVASLFIAWAGEGVANLRAVAAQNAAAKTPSTVTQITAGKRKLYSAPGVVNTDPATKLDIVPWTLATGGPAPVDGQFIPGNTPYRVDMRGDRNAAQTQVVFGRNTVSRITAPVERGETNTVAVAPKQNSVSVDPSKASAKVTVEMSGKTGNGGWRTASLATTTKGRDGLRFIRGSQSFVIDHRGPAATVKLTLSSTDKAALPQEATATLKAGRNQKLTLKPASWRKLGGGRLVVRTGGKTRRVKLRASAATKLRMGRPTTRVKGKRRTARVAITVPRDTASGAARVTYVVRRGKRRIANGTVSAGKPGRRTVTIRLSAKARRNDTLTVIGTALRKRGTRFTVATATRTARVR